MRLIYTASMLIALALSTQAAVLPPAATATPAPTPADKSLTNVSAGPTPAASLQRRCDEGAECASITAGPEVPIAVTTTMMTTKLVPCTTTTTVIDSQTTTLTLWSTEVQTSTEHISGASTVTVWLVTPAPEIKSKTWMQEETLTFVRTGTATSYWTETKAVQTSMLTVAGPQTTWTDGGKPAPTSCHDCDDEQPPAPPAPAPTVSSTPSDASPQPAWTQTTASGANPSPVQPVVPVGGGNPAPAVESSSSAIGWMGSPQAPVAGAPSATVSSAISAGPVQPVGAPIATSPGIATPNSNNSQGVPIQPGANPNAAPEAPGAADSPFTSNGSPSPAFFGPSAVVLAGTLLSLVCSVIVL